MTDVLKHICDCSKCHGRDVSLPCLACDMETVSKYALAGYGPGGKNVDTVEQAIDRISVALARVAELERALSGLMPG